jgi:sarcosine oxidase, subunit gamma
MADPISALGGATFDGFATVREIGPLGMISLRAKPDVKGLAKAVKAAVGTKLPATRRIEVAGDKAAGWMSPDEYLLVVPYAEVAATLAGLAKALAGEHHLAVDVSDARAVFRITGDKADQVLRKLSPVDFDRLEQGELRRSRSAQVPAAFWKDGDGFTLVCFRSVAGYVMGLLSHSAMAGSELA